MIPILNVGVLFRMYDAADIVSGHILLNGQGKVNDIHDRYLLTLIEISFTDPYNILQVRRRIRGWSLVMWDSDGPYARPAAEIRDATLRIDLKPSVSVEVLPGLEVIQEK